MNQTSLITPDLLAPYARWLSEPPTAPLPVLAPRDSATFHLDVQTPDGGRASVSVEGAPAWVWFLAGAGTAAVLFAVIAQSTRRRDRR